MATLKAKRVHIEVERSITEKIARTVFEHEVPCLEAHHGPGSVTIINDVPKDILDYGKVGETVALDAREEWERLKSAYGRHPEHNILTSEYVFQQNPRNMMTFNLAEYLAMRDGDDGLDDDMFELGEEQSPVNQTTSTIDPVDADGDGNIEVEELKTKLEQIGIKPHHNAGKDKLIGMLVEEVKTRLEVAEIDFEEDEPLEVLWHKLPDEARTANGE